MLAQAILATTNEASMLALENADVGRCTRGAETIADVARATISGIQCAARIGILDTGVGLGHVGHISRDQVSIAGQQQIVITGMLQGITGDLDRISAAGNGVRTSHVGRASVSLVVDSVAGSVEIGRAVSE